MGAGEVLVKNKKETNMNDPKNVNSKPRNVLSCISSAVLKIINICSGQKVDDDWPDWDYDQAVHVWILVESTQEFLLQLRAKRLELWPGLWDIATTGHIHYGDSALRKAQSELYTELKLDLPDDAFELIDFPQKRVSSLYKFDDEANAILYLVTIPDRIPLEAFVLEPRDVSEVRYMNYKDYRNALARKDPAYVPYDVIGKYQRAFDILASRYHGNNFERSLNLKRQISRYAPVTVSAKLTGLTESDREVLALLIKAAAVLDDIYSLQVCNNNLDLRNWLKGRMDKSELDNLKWQYYKINKSPWSSLDENEALLTTADSAVKLFSEATRPFKGWKGTLEYKTAFPVLKPAGANFYPQDLHKEDFESWKASLTENQQEKATSRFTVLKRHKKIFKGCHLDIAPYSQEYKSLLSQAAELLRKAGELTASPSLKRLLLSKADAFLTNDYYDSDIAWMDLDSKLEVTMGPYGTHEDKLFGYKATFEAFIGILDDESTNQLKLFDDNLQMLEANLPMDDSYKSSVHSSPIRVVQLVYNAGDVRVPQIVVYNLPHDNRVVKDRGTKKVMLKNVQEAKFQQILQPIADICITKEQRELVDFESYFTHAASREYCHEIGPHTITVPNGQQSTVMKELQELHEALEEAKADIVGLWALRFLIYQDLLPTSLLKSMYVSFLASSFQSLRFGLEETHGKGQALLFNWLYEKGAFVLQHDRTFSVDFSKIGDAVESLSREVLTIQGKGNKEAAAFLVRKYGVMTPPLLMALENLGNFQVPVDVTLTFPIAKY